MVVTDLSNSWRYFVLRTLAMSTREFVEMTSACLDEHGIRVRTSDHATLKWKTHSSMRAFMLVHMTFEYWSPTHDLWRAREPVSQFHGFETTTAASNRECEPSSPKYYTRFPSIRFRFLQRNPRSPHSRTLTIILAPNENPRP